MSTTIETEIITETSNVSDLMARYNSTKKSASEASKALTDNFTLKGMDGVNELVSKAMGEIKQFVDNGKEQSSVSKAGSRALTILDPNNKWAGKWFSNAKDNLEDEKLKEKSINEVIDLLVAQITKKREEVMGLVEAAAGIKIKMLEDKESYQHILTEAQLIVAENDPNSRAAMDAELLESMSKVALQSIDTDIKSQVDPLIASARMSCNQIAAILPTIEQDLKYKSGFKAFQQSLSDLNSIVKTTTDLAADAGDIIRTDINSTIYESVAMLSETGLDTKRLAKVAKEEELHHRKLVQVMDSTQAKMKEQFSDVKAIYAASLVNRDETTHVLLENYSEVASVQDNDKD